MTLVRTFFERFSSHKNTHPEYEIAEDDYLIDSSKFPDLPFPIAIGDHGYSLRRVGNPLSQDTGKRVFIVNTKDLEALYQKASISPEQVYEKLGELDLGGRLLCHNSDSIQLDHENAPKWTIIVKKIDHPHKNHWKTPDVLRIDVDPTMRMSDHDTAISLTQRLVETESGFIRGKSINLTNLTRDCQLHFAEPWASYASQADRRAFEDRMERQNASDEQREAALDEFDRVGQLRRSNTNTLVLQHLRDHQGSIPAPAVEGFMRQDQFNGSIVLRINRTEGLYDKIMALPEEHIDRSKIIEGLPKGMTIESLGNDSYGVNGIEVNGKMHVFSGGKTLEVPLLPHNTDRARVVLYFAAHTENRRKAMTLEVIRTKGIVTATCIDGIEEGEQIGFGTYESRVLFSYGLEKKKLFESQKVGVLSRQAKKTNHELTTEEKRHIEEDRLLKATPLAYSDNAPVKTQVILQR